MKIPPPPVVAELAGRVVLVELTRRLVLELLVLDAGPVAHVLEEGRVCQRVSLGRA